LGNLARAQGAPEEANRHFNHARRLLARHPANDPLPEAEGLTAARLAEMITALTSSETAR
jgi:chemotaxis protein methyltransferase CheR